MIYKMKLTLKNGNFIKWESDIGDADIQSFITDGLRHDYISFKRSDTSVIFVKRDEIVLIRCESD